MIKTHEAVLDFQPYRIRINSSNTRTYVERYVQRLSLKVHICKMKRKKSVLNVVILLAYQTARRERRVVVDKRWYDGNDVAAM